MKATEPDYPKQKTPDQKRNKGWDWLFTGMTLRSQLSSNEELPTLHSSKKRLHTSMCVFGIDFPKNYTSAPRKYYSGTNFTKITYHVFVCDSENCIEKLFGNYFLGKSHFSYMKYCFRNQFRNNFWLECMHAVMVQQDCKGSQDCVPFSIGRATVWSSARAKDARKGQGVINPQCIKSVGGSLSNKWHCHLREKHTTVGTQMTADPEKMKTRDWVSEEKWYFLRNRPCLESIVALAIFRLCSSCRTNH